LQIVTVRTYRLATPDQNQTFAPSPPPINRLWKHLRLRKPGQDEPWILSLRVLRLSIGSTLIHHRLSHVLHCPRPGGARDRQPWFISGDVVDRRRLCDGERYLVYALYGNAGFSLAYPRLLLRAHSGCITSCSHCRLLDRTVHRQSGTHDPAPPDRRKSAHGRRHRDHALYRNGGHAPCRNALL